MPVAISPSSYSVRNPPASGKTKTCCKKFLAARLVFVSQNRWNARGSLRTWVFGHFYGKAAALLIIFIINEVSSKTCDVSLAKRQSKSESFCQVAGYGKWHENHLFSIFGHSGPDILYNETYSRFRLLDAYRNMLPIGELGSIVKQFPDGTHHKEVIGSDTEIVRQFGLELDVINIEKFLCVIDTVPSQVNASRQRTDLRRKGHLAT